MDENKLGRAIVDEREITLGGSQFTLGDCEFTLVQKFVFTLLTLHFVITCIEEFIHCI